MFALSTSWNTAASNSGKQIVNEIRNLGFDSIELCFSHTKKEISQISKDLGVRVVSLHNFCPIPDGLLRKKALPDFFSLSSLNKTERKKALKFSKRTILLAKKLKTKAVILHTGRVEIEDYTRDLIKLKIKGQDKTSRFEFLKELATREREQNKHKYLDCIFKSLRELSDFAYNLGIALGIENRFYIREIPSFEEIKFFLENFHKKGLYYWHDIGHAYVLEKLGFAKHLDYLKSYKEYLLGIHLHDVKKCEDHMAPFTGEIDFKQIKPYIKRGTIKVIEAHRPATAKEIIESRKKLEKLFSNN
ncbi:MAG: TIM barrel protein [Candidatus Omnitrophota bacterium]